MMQETFKDVQDYYGNVLESNEDLKTSACCTAESPPEYMRSLISNVHESVQSKFYGCGSPIPAAIEGCTVLDLGCGTGRDAYVLSQLVGENGAVIGIDMTTEQLSVANQYIGWHMDKFGYEEPNVEFKHGYVEDLKQASIEDNSIDLIVSNCVINLSPDKESVFSEIIRVLKPGGELYFSDVFSGQRIPDHLKKDKVLYGECLSGAMYTEDFRRMMTGLGIPDTRVVNKRLLTLEDPELFKKAGMIDFYSMTIRAFKVELEDICENFGHIAYYNGSIDKEPHRYILDDHHEFKTGMPVPVCGNTAKMLSDSRLGAHFKIEGDFSTHYGPFDCTTSPDANDTSNAGCC